MFFLRECNSLLIAEIVSKCHFMLLFDIRLLYTWRNFILDKSETYEYVYYYGGWNLRTVGE